MQTDRRLLSLLSTVYLFIPFFFFAAGWLRMPWAVALILAGAAVLAVAARDAFTAIERPDASFWRAALPALFLLLGWVLLSGAGGFGYQNDDYISKNALLKDLLQQPWPITAQVDGRSLPVVYYFGYYLPAAAVGKWLGWAAANIFLFGWTLAGVLLAWGWFLDAAGLQAPFRARRIFLLTLFFCLAGGLDVLGYYRLTVHAFDPFARLDRWAGVFEYSSQSTLLFWVPQHALAGWVLAGMLFHAARRPAQAGLLLAALSASVLVSPFSVAGIAPLLAVVFALQLAGGKWRELASRQNLLPAVLSLPVGAVCLAFLLSNRYGFPRGFLWEFVEPREVPLRLGSFLLLEFGLLALCLPALLAADRGKPLAAIGLEKQEAALLIASPVLLALLPLYSMGYFNDFVMRVSIPALFLWWALAGRIVMRLRPRAGLQRALYVVCLVVLVLGSAASLGEVARSVAHYHFCPPDPSKVYSLSDRHDLILIDQMTGAPDQFFFEILGR
jgi:hypothetical protein